MGVLWEQTGGFVKVIKQWLLVSPKMTYFGTNTSFSVFLCEADLIILLHIPRHDQISPH